MKLFLFLLLSLLLFHSRLCDAISSCPLKPTRFRTNNQVNPLAIVDNKPVFSWALGFANGKFEPPSDDPLGENHGQSAYRIVCTLWGTNTTILWDSGKVASNQTLQIEYDGMPLQALQRVRWHVQVWDLQGNPCLEIIDPEKPPFFETGLLDEAGWGGAEWIARFGPLGADANLCSMMARTEENQVPRFRAKFLLEKDRIDLKLSLVEVRAYISGLGYYQLYMDGQKVGNAMLDPGFTTYSKRVLYSTYNITYFFKSSKTKEHVVGVELGNGWWNILPIYMFGGRNLRVPMIEQQNITSSRPMFRLHIVGFLENGTTVSLLKSSSKSSLWQAAGSPTVFNSIYLGEHYDARLEPGFDGWTTAAYTVKNSDNSHRNNTINNNNVSWKDVVMADTTGIGKLEAQEIPPVRIQKSLPSISVSRHTNQNGILVEIIDTTVNHAGLCRFQIKNDPAIAGQTIKMRYGEFLQRDGSLNVLTSAAGHIVGGWNPEHPCQPGVAYQGDNITLGSRPVDWRPSWSWHGFRYIEITYPPSWSEADNNNVTIECYTMRTDVDVIANFSSSSPWLSQLRQLVRNTYESNLMSIQSDCPHRERFGYGGDVLGAGEAGLSIYDFSSFYRKRVLDYNDAQIRNSTTGQLSGFTEVAPSSGTATAGLGPETGPIGWETFQPIALEWLYKYYGDVRTMRESFPNTMAYIHLLDSEPEGIEHGLGDWEAVEKTDVAYTGRGFQLMSYRAFANISKILRLNSSIAHRYRQKAAKLVRIINTRFMDDSGLYRVSSKKNATQTGQAFALFHDLLEDETNLKAQALAHLASNARASSFLSGACQTKPRSKLSPKCEGTLGGPGPHVTAGLFGMKWLLMALADGGMNDLAYEMVTTKTYPGLGWMMHNSFCQATTIWERWAFNDYSRSHNHPMFGSTEVWLLQSVAGIQPHPSARGMDHMLIRPNPPSQMHHAGASFESPRGITTVEWRRESPNSKLIHLSVTLPPNCIGTVHFPADLSHVIVHNHAVEVGVWIPSLSDRDRGSYAFTIGSGHHEFKSMAGNGTGDSQEFPSNIAHQATE